MTPQICGWNAGGTISARADCEDMEVACRAESAELRFAVGDRSPWAFLSVVLHIDPVSSVCDNPWAYGPLEAQRIAFPPHGTGASDWQRSAFTVKKIAFALIAVMAGLLLPVAAQDGAKPAAPPKETGPHRVGLVDMAEVFQGYKKFEDLRAELTAEIEKSDAQAKTMVERMQKMQQDMIDQKLAPGSAQYEQGEKGLLDAKGEFEAFRAATH